MTEQDPGKELIAKLAELQALYRDLRTYEGPFDPHFPRTVFHMLFCPPLRCSVDPLEVYGVVQRIFHSKDGKYLMASFGTKPTFRRVTASPHDLKAVKILHEIRNLVREHQIWATYVDPKTGSYFPPVSFMAGTLLPVPGDPVVIPLADYFEKLREFDAHDPPPLVGELIPSTVDITDLDKATRGGAELADPIPDLCSTCGTKLVEFSGQLPGGLANGSRQCPDCRTVYVRPPKDEELTPDQREKRDLREQVMDEFLRRIADEFPPPSNAVGTAEELEEGLSSNDGYLFGADGEGWKGQE